MDTAVTVSCTIRTVITTSGTDIQLVVPLGQSTGTNITANGHRYHRQMYHYDSQLAQLLRTTGTAITVNGHRYHGQRVPLPQSVVPLGQSLGIFITVNRYRYHGELYHSESQLA